MNDDAKNNGTAEPIMESAQRAEGMWSPSTVFSSLALLVSFAALFVSFYETSILETQNKASVWPYIALGTNYSSDGFAVDIVNKGVGPAMIKSAQMWVNGKKVTDPIAMLSEVNEGNPGFGYNILRSFDAGKSVLSSGERKIIFGYPWTPETRAFQEKLNKTTIHVSVCYCSIFEECWKTALQAPPKPVDLCTSE